MTLRSRTPPPRIAWVAAALLSTALLASSMSAQATGLRTGALADDQPVRGWTILSDSEPEDRTVIAAAAAYRINHLELSHQVVMNLREVRNDTTRALVNRLTDAAHRAGIQEVVVWDHALYDLSYYPKRFRTGPGGTLDFDDPAFWEWLKQDYRDMLDRLPNVNGLVLTFIETGARAERQHSTKFATPEDKLAAVVNAVADVVVGERHLNLYARTFAYTHAEYANIIGAVNKFRPGVRLLMKETPHDFFLTHPNDFYAGTINRPTVVEFDATGEFNGQGQIANTWPEYILRRANDLLRRPHVIGYTARTDRYGGTRIVGHAGEIDLFALRRAAETKGLSARTVSDEFIVARYGRPTLPFVTSAFANAFDIVSSTLYTLGTNVANHSALDYDGYSSSYARHVSGKWLVPPIAHVQHGVNRDLHYWKDVINHLAPPWVKTPTGAQWNEVPWVIDSGWVQPGEQMNAEFLAMVMTEKNDGVAKARESLAAIEAGRSALAPADYDDLHALFERTLLTARLHRAVAEAYYGFRVWARGDTYRTAEVTASIHDGLREIVDVSNAIRARGEKSPHGQWEWAKDAELAMKYHEWITTGWPRETHGYVNPYGGVAFGTP